MTYRSIPRCCGSRCATSTARSRSTPTQRFHFHTGRPLAARLGYEPDAVDQLPDRAVESFAGVGNPFSLRRLGPGERVVDVGSGAGFDTFIAAGQVGETGQVVGIDMTPEMLEKSNETAEALGAAHVEFREGLAERMELPRFVKSQVTRPDGRALRCRQSCHTAEDLRLPYVAQRVV